MGSLPEEILRRRHKERATTGRYKFGWVGVAAAAIWLWMKFTVAPADFLSLQIRLSMSLGSLAAAFSTFSFVPQAGIS